VSTTLIVALVVIGAAVIVAALLIPRALGPPKWSAAIATATPGGTYYPLGRQLALILERLPGTPIERVLARQSSGSQENVLLLLDSIRDDATPNIAFVMGPALVRAAQGRPDVPQELSVLARLYTDVMQIVVREDQGIQSIGDLRGKRVFVGTAGSGTRMVAPRILEIFGLPPEDYRTDDASSFTDVADKFIDGQLDAGFFMSGTPTEAVQRVLESGAGTLLSLDDETRERLTTGAGNLGLASARIPANFYPRQPQRVQTVGADVFLVSRTDIPEDLAYLILTGLFDNIADLLLAHARAQDVKITEALDALELPVGFSLHPGAARFAEDQQDLLLVATGALYGKYYDLGRRIQSLLNERRIGSRVVQTDGSLENARLLNSERTLAIMQYDAALASSFGEPKFVYGVDLTNASGVPAVKDLRRIATLHEEQLHIAVRRDKLASLESRLNQRLPESDEVAITTLTQLGEALMKLPSSEPRLRVSLGPENSATQLVAQAVLELHGIQPTSIAPSFLPVPDMANRLHTGEIDIGMFVSYVPSEALKSILNSDEIRLLSLEQKHVAPMTRTVFTTTRIRPGQYASQREGEAAIQTISTRAVLVTREGASRDVRKITEAVFEGAAFLGIAADSLAQELPSLPLHPGAKLYYQEARLLPTEPGLDILTMVYYVLAILVILFTAYRGLMMGLLKLRRDGTFNDMARQTLAVRVDADILDSVRRLVSMRDEIEERVRRRWWQTGELDKRRWRYLYDLIRDRITEAKDNLTRELVSEIRAVAATTRLDETTRRERNRSIELRVWKHFENGELEASQREMLLLLLHTIAQQGTEAGQE
jgi:TRAP transporter TAXI family solute receptor